MKVKSQIYYAVYVSGFETGFSRVLIGLDSVHWGLTVPHFHI